MKEQGTGAREWLGLTLVLFVAVVWLNQGISLSAWKETLSSQSTSTFDTLRAPLLFLYRRAPDEEMYFATSSATFGKPYDQGAFAIRGDTSLPPVDVPADGHIHAPYAEVPFEYPPPNLPFVLLPRLASDTFEGYARVFGAIMGLLLALSAWLAARIASPANDSRERSQRMIGFALLLLAHGALGIQRLDAIVALLLMLVVRSAIRREDRSFGFFAGLVGATKIVPIVVALAILAASGVVHTKRDKKRRLRDVALGGIAGLGLGFLPMLILSSGSFGMMLRYHGDRGLHVESSLGVVYGALKALFGMPERAVLDYGSYNFHGGVADALAKGTPILLCVLVGLVAHAAYRSAATDNEDDRDDEGGNDEPRRTRIVITALVACLALWLGSKVFSPQYLTWALPLTIALPDRKSSRRITFALGLIVLLSQLYYRGYYDHVYNQSPLGIITMVVRLGLLTTLFVVLVRWLRVPTRFDRLSTWLLPP